MKLQFIPRDQNSLKHFDKMLDDSDFYAELIDNRYFEFPAEDEQLIDALEGDIQNEIERYNAENGAVIFGHFECE